MSRDTIYSRLRDNVEDFAFDEQVAEVFDDMIDRSVPLYQEVQRATAGLAAALVQPGGVIYDLGCSTGTTLAAVCKAVDDIGGGLVEKVRIVGVDNSAPMLAACGNKLQALGLGERIELKIHPRHTQTPVFRREGSDERSIYAPRRRLQKDHENTGSSFRRQRSFTAKFVPLGFYLSRTERRNPKCDYPNRGRRSSVRFHFPRRYD